jgi:hypothetical protein
MADASVRRREHDEDAIYFAAEKNRYVGAVLVGFGPDGKRLRRKVTGTTKQEVRDKLRALHAELDVGLVVGGIHGPGGGGGLARARAVEPVGADGAAVPGRRKAADGPAGIPASAQAICGGGPIGAGCAEQAAVDAVAADCAQLPRESYPTCRIRRSGGPERGSVGQAARWSRGQAVQGSVGRAGGVLCEKLVKAAADELPDDGGALAARTLCMRTWSCC